MPRVRKWTKPNQKLLFCGEWGICNDNCDCGGKETLIQTVGEEKEKTSMGLTFQVAAVKKPLISVKRITEKGNRVCFGPGEEDNFIENRASGDKIKLRQAGKGSYLLDVSFSGGKKTEITVDSGAEENVCPWEWGQEFGVNTAGKKMIFRGANGAWIDHYGERKVFVQSPF
jgi:hypothetical protein